MIPDDVERSDVDALKVPVVDIATEVGSSKAANIVALAAFVARSKLVSLETLKHCIEEEFEKRPNLIPLNMKAMEAGIAAAKN